MRGQLVMHQRLHHVYIHDVNIDASQADRALNWTARITKNIPSISGLPMLIDVSTGLSTARVFIRRFNLFKVDEISYNWLLLCVKMQTGWLSQARQTEQRDKHFIF